MFPIEMYYASTEQEGVTGEDGGCRQRNAEARVLGATNTKKEQS